MYKPSRKSKHTQTRKELFSTLAKKESRYKHYIPPNAITQTAKKHACQVSWNL